GVLGSLAGALEARLLALLHTRISGEQPVLPQHCAVLLVDLQQCAGDSMTDRAGLAGHTAAVHRGNHVEGTDGVGHAERAADGELQQRTRVPLLGRLAIDDDVANTRLEDNSRNAGLTTSDSRKGRASGCAASLSHDVCSSEASAVGTDSASVV